MIALNAMIDLTSMIFTESDSKDKTISVKGKDNNSRNDFKEKLDNSMKSREQERPSKPAASMNRNEKIRPREVIKPKEDNEPVKVKETEKEIKPQEIDDKEEPVVKEEASVEENQESNTQAPVQQSEFSQEELNKINELAQKLDIEPQTLINLLQTLNIKPEEITSQTFDQTVKQIETGIQNFMQDLAEQAELGEGETFKAKAHLVLNIHNKVSGKELKTGEDEQFKNIHLNIKETITVKGEAEIKNQNASGEIAQPAQQELSQNSEINPVNSQTQSQEPEVTEEIKTTENKPSGNIQEGAKEKVKETDLDKQPFVIKNLKVEVKHTKNTKETGAVESTQSAEQGTQEANEGEQSTNIQNKDFSKVFENNKVVNLKVAEKADTSNTKGQDSFTNGQPQASFNRISSLKANINLASNVKEGVFQQVVENAKLTLSETQTEMELNLKPESLGKLSLKIATENGMVIARITTETQQVKSMIESNLASLKESLQEQGITVQEMSVSVGQDSRRDLYNSSFHSQKSNRVSNSSTNNNSVAVTENYMSRLAVRNPYLISESSVDYTA